MTILLTGGTGYIGSHIAAELLNANHEVVIADDLSNSSVDVIGKIKAITNKDVLFYEVDVTVKEKVRKIFDENQIDAVIHLAGFKSVRESVLRPLKYYKNNLQTTITMLEVMTEYDVNHFVFSSSATVYGDTVSPYSEDMKTGNCTNPYGWTKYIIEQMLRDYAKVNPDFSVVSLRYFNPIGAHESGLIGENPNDVPNNLMPHVTQVASGKLKRLYIFGNDYPTRDGTCIRDYIHVVDLAKGHLAALEYVMQNKGIDVVNLGTGIGYSVLEIVNTFSRVNNISIPYEFAARREGDIASFCANPTKAWEKYHWKAEKDLEDMCRDSWRWQRMQS